MGNPGLWKSLGLEVARWADSNFLYGVGTLESGLYATVLDAIKQKTPPLDWNYKFEKHYANEKSVLWVYDPEGNKSFLPQVIVISPNDQLDEASIKVELELSCFYAPMPASLALDFYRRNADGKIKKIFFDGENARLIDWDINEKKLVFQGSSYFDYLQTNLALDAPMPIGGTLRNNLVTDGCIEPLSNSKLANATGLNGLVFSNDGYMIIQKRNDNVLVRPGEICSGFSGTLDKIDIVHAVQSGGYLVFVDTLREMIEEIGIKYNEVDSRRFLGITRELIRGGTPEMFYAVNVSLPAKTILERIPKDKEGKIISVNLGPYASSSLISSDAKKLPDHFWTIVQEIQSSAKGPISIPLLTNLVLWFQASCPQQVGSSPLPTSEQ